MTVLSRAQLEERRDTTRAEEQRLRNQRDQLLARAQADDALTDPGVKEKLDRLQTGIDRAAEQALEAGRAVLNDVLRRGDYSSEEAVPSAPAAQQRTEDTAVAPYVRAARDGGQRVIERHVNDGTLNAEAADRLDRLARHPEDHQALTARYLAAVGDESYRSAFGKMLADPQSAHLGFNPREVEAVRVVKQIMAERAMNTGTGSAGQFALPFTLDTSVVLSSAGAQSPIRDLCRVITISTHDWKGLSSDGVTVAYVGEATAATDASPVLAQPSSRRSSGGRSSHSRSSSARTGGRCSPSCSGCAPTARHQRRADVPDRRRRVQSADRDSRRRRATRRLARADNDDGGDRDRRRLPPQAGAADALPGQRHVRDEPERRRRVPALRRGRQHDGADHRQRHPRPVPRLPAADRSTMVSTTTTTASKIAIFADWQAAYQVVDRLGITAELIQHLFGAAQGNLPTGQRGLYVYGRTGAAPLVPNAARFLEVK